MKRPDAATVFAGLALIFGSILVFLIPPFQSPDEPNHFFRACQVSEGVIFPQTTDRRLGGLLPASLVQLRDSFSRLKMNYDARLDRDKIFHCLEIPLDKDRKNFTDFPNTAIYAPTAYLPQAFATGILRICGGTPLQMLYAARLSNLLVWVLLVFAAIRMMPFGEQLIAAIALLPASLVMAASANADVVTNGLCWWLTASFLRYGFTKSNLRLPVFTKQWGAFILVCANKLIALPLVLLNLMPSRRDEWRKQLFPFSILAVSGLVAALAWGGLANRRFIPYDAYNTAVRQEQTLNEGVDPARQLAFMRERPFVFIRRAGVSLARALPSIAAHFAGKFGWEKNYLHPAWLALLWLALAAMLASTGDLLSARQRVWAAVIVVLYVGLFAATMYALWCPVGSPEVSNFQGRYFVPIAPVAALALAGRWLQSLRKQIWLATLAVLTGGNMALIVAVLQRYYW